jgi:hypothetical protein
MPSTIYHFIEDSRRPDVQLAGDDGILLLFSSKDLAGEKKKHNGKGGIIRHGTLADLMKLFNCCKVHLDPPVKEEPRKEDAICLCKCPS